MNATHTDHPPSPVITAIVPNGGLSMQYINTTPQANYSDDPFALEVGLNSIATLGPTQELSNSSLTVVSPLIMAKTEGEELGMLFDERFEVSQVAMFDNTMTGGITPEETIPSHQDQQIMIQQTAHAGKRYRRMRDRKRQTGTNTLPLRWNRLTGEVFDLDAGHVNSEQENSGQQKCLRSATPTFQRSASYYSAELEPVPVGPQQTGANLIPLGIRKRHQTFHSIPSTPKSGMTPLPPPTKQKARTRGKKWSMLNATARFDEGDRSPLDEQHWYRNRPALRGGGRRERSGSPHHRLSSHRDYRESRTQRRRRQRINSHRSELRYCHSTNGAQDQIYLSSVDSNWVPAGLSSMALGPTDPGPNPASEFPFLAVSHYEPPNIQQEGIYYPPLPATKSNRFGNRPSAAVQDQLATLEWIGESYLHPLAIDLVAETHGSFGVTRGVRNLPPLQQKNANYS